MRIETTERFTCPIETLWNHIVEPEKQKLWMKGVLSNEATSPGPRQVGSTFRMVIQEGRKAAEYQGEVTALEEPHRLEIVFGGGNFPKGMRMRVDYRLTGEGPQTRLDYACTVQCEKLGLFMRMMFVVFRLFSKWQLKSFMRSLRKLVEAPAKTAT